MRRVRAQQADDVAREQARTQKMTQRQEEYTGAIQSQEAALTQARAVPAEVRSGNAIMGAL